MPDLAFYDYARQDYAETLPLKGSAEAEFMVGDYGKTLNNGVGLGGEFAIHLHRFSRPDPWPFTGQGNRPGLALTAQLRVFSDATGSLDAFMPTWRVVAAESEAGRIRSADDLTRILVENGLRDLSHKPVLTPTATHDSESDR